MELSGERSNPGRGNFKFKSLEVEVCLASQHQGQGIKQSDKEGSSKM